jgi:hypothetical protein
MNENRNPQINISKMPIGGDVAGAIVAAGSIAICLVGLPALWYALPAAIVLGCGVALILRFTRRKASGASWILPAPKE